MGDPDDIALLTTCLGRPPEAAFEVCVRDAAGAPVVIRNHPLLDDGRPMPTLYWLVDPDLRSQYEAGVLGVRLAPNRRGRRGEGAVFHCAHGSYTALQRVVDWKPWRYFTMRTHFDGRRGAPPPHLMTFELMPLADDRTRVAVRARFESRALAIFARLLGRRHFVGHYRTSLERLAVLMAE